MEEHMDIKTIIQKRSEVITKYGPWTAHNIQLRDDIYSIAPEIIGDEVKLRRIVQCVLDLAGGSVEGLRILDLACLEGLYAIEFARHKAACLGIEGREANIEKARFAKQVLLLDNLEFTQDDVRNLTIEKTLSGMGVQWMRTVHTYHVEKMRKTFDEAFTSDFNGLKVIIAEGECQLERQRRIKPWIAGLLKAGKRVVRVKYGVDEDVCTGDHACIRLSGCPTLTLKDSPDPLRVDPVATVIDGCVGCGLCGENAHAATLCPSFYRAEVIRNPHLHERLLDGLRGTVLRWLQAA